MFEHQFKHEVVGLETKFFWIPLSQQISFMPSTSQINLSDQEPRYWHFCDWFLWRKLLDTFSIVKLTRQYITIILPQFVLPKLVGFSNGITRVLADFTDDRFVFLIGHGGGFIRLVIMQLFSGLTAYLNVMLLGMCVTHKRKSGVC